MMNGRLSLILSLAAASAPVALAAPAEEGGHGGTTGFGNLVAPFLDPATNFAFAAFVVFLLIAFSMGAFGYITKSLDDRAAGIKKQLDESRQLREEAAAALAEAERRQKEADQAAEEMIKQAKADAKMMVEQARKDLAEKVARFPKPDRVFLLDLSAKAAFARLKGPKDRMEKKGIAYMERARKAFLRFARENPRRFSVHDGTLPPKTIQREIQNNLSRLLP